MQTVPKRLARQETPEELALRLSHLPGFVFLDSSSAGPGECRAVSILSALPTRVLRGNLLTNAEPLRRALRARPRLEIDCGLPTGGLIGSIDFSGRYHFGQYDSLLAYDHNSCEWLSVGTKPHFLDFTDSPVTPRRGGQRPRLRFTPGMTRTAYSERVCSVQEWIAAGDVYQVNLSHRFEALTADDVDPFQLYLSLREVSPAPYAAYLNLGNRIVLSSSPECFLKMSGASVVTRPIKGTRPRFPDSDQDEKSAYDLITSPKEVAELVMITDLERNDIGQVCTFGSVRVRELLKLERYEQVFHLVSTVEGQLRPDCDHVECLSRCWPGGSISGAPKKRALEIIAELEIIPRGLYTGSIGYLGYNGESQFNIAIRTLVRERGRWHFHTGAGIVADSHPEAEYEETLHKAAGILKAAGNLA